MADYVKTLTDADSKFNEGVGVLEYPVAVAMVNTEKYTADIPDHATLVSLKIVASDGSEITAYTAKEIAQSISEGIITKGAIEITATGAIAVDSIIRIAVLL